MIKGDIGLILGKRKGGHEGRLSVIGPCVISPDRLISASAPGEEVAPLPALGAKTDQHGTHITGHWITSFPLFS